MMRTVRVVMRMGLSLSLAASTRASLRGFSRMRREAKSRRRMAFLVTRPMSITTPKTLITSRPVPRK